MDVLALSRRIPFFGFFGGSASDDDFADRLNYKYTVAILVVFAFIVTNKHFGHNQINCWVPALFSKNFEEYTNLVCWITNTYYIPFDKQIPTDETERRSTELKYYQWVAYILLILALLFYLPRIIWRTLSVRSGVDIKDVIEASYDFKSVSKLEKNQKMMEYMIGTMDQYVDDPRRQSKNRKMNCIRKAIVLSCFMFGKFLGNYLVILYLFVKLLYILNCLGQLFLISILLGRNYYIYGASIFRDMIQGKGYADSEYFPRVTMCKFQVRELGLKNFSHEYNVQCVLPINLFNQQIFTFLWFWYLILLIINTVALFIWIYRFIPRNQYNYAIRRIKLLRISVLESSKAHKSSLSSSSVGSLHHRKKRLRWQNDNNNNSNSNSNNNNNDDENRQQEIINENETETENEQQQKKRPPLLSSSSKLMSESLTSHDVVFEEDEAEEEEEENEQRENEDEEDDTEDDEEKEEAKRQRNDRRPPPRKIFPNLPDQYPYEKSPYPATNNQNNQNNFMRKRNCNTRLRFSNSYSSYNNCGRSNDQKTSSSYASDYSAGGPFDDGIDSSSSTYSAPPVYMTLSAFCVKNYKSFVYEYLESDGMFMLRMIAAQSGDFVCTQVIHNLWKLYLFKLHRQSLLLLRSASSNNSASSSTAASGGSGSSPAEKRRIIIKHQQQQQQQQPSPQKQSFVLASNYAANQKKRSFISRLLFKKEKAAEAAAYKDSASSSVELPSAATLSRSASMGHHHRHHHASAPTTTSIRYSDSSVATATTTTVAATIAVGGGGGGGGGGKKSSNLAELRRFQTMKRASLPAARPL